jgi:hypothetical protein
MGTSDTDAALDALLAQAGAQRSRADEEQIFADVWSRVQAAMDGAPVSVEDELQQRRLDLFADREKAARRRRRVTRLASAALAVAVAGGGTAAAAELLTRTGEHLTGWEVGAGGSGELLDPGGSDRPKVFDQVTADIPFAPGHEAARTWALNFEPAESNVRVSVSHLRSWMATTAVCTWGDAWLAADTAGDDAARAAAAKTLAASMTWEPVRTFDRDHGEPDPGDAGTAETYFGWLRPLAAAAGAGDRQRVLDEVAGAHACSPEVMPFLSAHGSR